MEACSRQRGWTTDNKGIQAIPLSKAQPRRFRSNLANALQMAVAYLCVCAKRVSEPCAACSKRCAQFLEPYSLFPSHSTSYPCDSHVIWKHVRNHVDDHSARSLLFSTLCFGVHGSVLLSLSIVTAVAPSGPKALADRSEDTVSPFRVHTEGLQRNPASCCLTLDNSIKHAAA